MINFNKNANMLVPVIIQDANDQQVLMLGYMNREAYEKTLREKKVTFYSRSKKRLWTKGESSGNYLWVKSITADCDEDTLLIEAIPAGPICHKGSDGCFGDKHPKGFLYQLENIIARRKAYPQKGSYTSSLFEKGINKIAQKVGEEAVELVIEAKDGNRQLFLNEAADLMYHLLVLLQFRDVPFSEVEKLLRQRNL